MAVVPNDGWGFEPEADCGRKGCAHSWSNHIKTGASLSPIVYCFRTTDDVLPVLGAVTFVDRGPNHES